MSEHARERNWREVRGSIRGGMSKRQEGEGEGERGREGGMESLLEPAGESAICR